MTGKQIARRTTSSAMAVAETTSLRGWADEAEAAAVIARGLVVTSFIPDSLKVWQGDPRAGAPLDLDATTAQVTATLLAGQELGFGPMAALRSIDVIRGTPAVRAMALRAMLQNQGHDIAVVESTATRAVVRGRRGGTGEPQTSIWTLDRAKIAGLYPGKPDGQWRRQTQAMLVARATAECARWVAADAILGMPYIREELEDLEAEDVAAPDVTDEAAEEKPKRRVKRKTAKPLPVLPAAPPAVTIPQQADGSHDQDEPPITKDQLTKLHVVLKSCGITEADAGRTAVAEIVGRPLGSSKELTRAEASRVIDELEKLAAADRDNAEGDED